MSIDGILNINKPRGMTSHDVVGLVRRLVGQKRVGHAGTLDPMAEGVLVVALGKATRLVEYVVESRKTYCAEIVLGITTTTYDAEGDIVTSVPDVRVDETELRRGLDRLTGHIQQVPPMYSAVKTGGHKLYELARRGVEVERQPREVTIHSVRLLDWQCPVLKIELVVSKGTYIRSFAYDLGQQLGTGAYLASLVRVASGRFSIDDAVTTAELSLAAEHGYWRDLVYAADEGMLGYDAVILDQTLVDGVRQGQGWLAKDGVRPDHDYGPTRAYSPDGEMIAIVEMDRAEARWQPKKVLV